MRSFITALCLLFATSAANAAGHSSTYIVKEGTLSVAETVAKLEAAIEAAPPKLMAKIDHGSNAMKAEMELNESVLLILGAPKVGTPIMQANPMVGLELPVKILVWNDNGQTKIGYLNPTELNARFELDGKADKQLGMMTKVLDMLTNAGMK